jgi:SAM-dependent methyltransferase
VASPTCNICGSPVFGDTYGEKDSAFLRRNVRCEGCGSLERHRLIFEVLRLRGLLSGNRRILHLAPEECLATPFRNRFGSSYLSADIDPGQFPFAVARLDLCRDLPTLAPASFDIVLHNHVLEHVACDYRAVAAGLHRLVKPGGLHIFSIPFLEGGFREALEAHTGAERTARFGQSDHMRIFSPIRSARSCRCPRITTRPASFPQNGFSPSTSRKRPGAASTTVPSSSSKGWRIGRSSMSGRQRRSRQALSLSLIVPTASCSSRRTASAKAISLASLRSQDG